MAEPFVHKLLKQTTFLNRLLKRYPKENIGIEINNALAKVPAVNNLRPEIIDNALQKHRCHQIPSREMEAVYRQYAEFCVKDKHLSDEELKGLEHLKNLLGLSEAVAQKIMEEAAGAVYQNELLDVLSDKDISDDERAFLEKLQNDLLLTKEIEQKLSDKARGALVEGYLREAIADQRLSPDEEREFEALAKKFNVEVTYGGSSKQVLDQYRLYWIIENADLPVISVPIALQRDEECYFSQKVDWFELRKVTKRINYGGPVASIRIAKGIRWRMGSLAMQPVSEDVMTKIDSGTIYLTSKRLLFTGAGKTSAIQLKKIIAYTPYKNGVEIIKDSGKSPFLQFMTGVDIFSMILGRLLGER